MRISGGGEGERLAQRAGGPAAASPPEADAARVLGRDGFVARRPAARPNAASSPAWLPTAELGAGAVALAGAAALAGGLAFGVPLLGLLTVQAGIALAIAGVVLVGDGLARR